MTSRNFLKAGNLVEPIPFGVLVTAKYQPSGMFQSASVNLESKDAALTDSDKLLNNKLTSILVDKKLIPNSILTQNGTVSVIGVLTIDRPVTECGDVPYSQYTKLLELASAKNTACKFYALDANCTNIVLASGVYTRNWLKFQKFNLLPGITIPLRNCQSAIDDAVLGSDIRYLPIIGYYSFDKNNKSIYIKSYHIVKVDEINPYLDESGFLHTNITCKYSCIDDYITLNTSYYESIIKFNLKVGDFVIIDENDQIVMKYFGNNGKINSNEYTCKVCGRKYVIQDDFTICPNTKCLSHMYNDVYHLLDTFGISKGKILSYAEYKDLVNDKSITKLSDVLTLEMYSNIRFSLSMYKILDACIPEETIRDRTPIWDLCAACSHSYSSIIHYIDNPDDIFTDLQVYSPQLVAWLRDNSTTVKEICDLPNIIIVESVKKFDGAPIFRDRNICLTGTFRHGTISDVSSILMSYSANIVAYKECDIVVVGDVKENIDGRAINFAKDHNITIMNETDFFALYEIDDDLDKLNNSK